MTAQNRDNETAQPRRAAQSPPASDDDTEEGFVVRDKRRPSPRPRPAEGATEHATPGEADVTEKQEPRKPKHAKPDGEVFAAELEALRDEVDDRTKDLQRLTAEYANYRRRVERDRALVAEQATGAVLAELLGVLDDIDRARDHGDLVGPFGSVAEQLVSVLTKLGLAPLAEKGDAFDPTRHEAVAHSLSSEVTEPTCVQVFRRGYQFGERLLRPALVAVADPSDEEPDEVEAASAAATDAEVVDAEPAEAVDAPAGATDADDTGDAVDVEADDADAKTDDTEAADAEAVDAEAVVAEAADAEAEEVDAEVIEAELVESDVVDAKAAAVAAETEEESDDSDDDSPDNSDESPEGSDDTVGEADEETATATEDTAQTADEKADADAVEKSSRPRKDS